MTEKIRTTKLQSAFIADVKNLQEVTCKLNSLLFGRELDAPPVVSVATHAGASLESCRFDDTIHMTGCPVERSFFIVLNGTILKDKRATLEAIAHNLIHLVQLRYGVMPSKSHAGFKILAERFGLVAEYATKNSGYSNIRFTPSKWDEIEPHFEGVNFQTFIQASEKAGDKKPAKKGKYTYISPNGVDTVISDNGNLVLLSPFNGDNKQWVLADETTLRAVKARRRELAKKFPNPESRGKVIK